MIYFVWFIIEVIARWIIPIYNSPPFDHKSTVCPTTHRKVIWNDNTTLFLYDHFCFLLSILLRIEPSTLLSLLVPL